MDLIKRGDDVITGSHDLEYVYSLKQFPVFLGCTDQAQEKDIKADMNWYISASSGCIQMNPLLPLDIVYMDSHQSSSVGGVWRAHHKDFAAFVFATAQKYVPMARKILEGGGGSGILSIEYAKLHSDPEWVIVEPNPFPSAGVKARFIKAFLDESFIPDQNYDIFVHSHTWEHTYKPVDFIRNISRHMPDGALQIFSVPDMAVWLERNYPSCLNFEHTYMLTEDFIMYILNNSGWRFLDKKIFQDGHSVFYAFIKESEKHNFCFNLNKDANKKRQNFINYCDYFKNKVEELNTIIDKTINPVYLFGGHILSQYLLALGLNENKIVSILDNAQSKQGKRLYGSRLFVNLPEIIKGVSNPIIILIDNPYAKEIKEDILENINNTAIFLN